ncbi:MAG: zinc-ribbon domain-containing protein [Eubacteriaceae bacterium]|nr:zinc-ribbon domain-containing protein [Eubacteriaceae bacterium]
MISYIYSKVLSVLRDRPARVWGVTLFYSFVASLAALVGVIPVITIPVSYVFASTLAMALLTKYRTGTDPKCKEAFNYFTKEHFLHIAGANAYAELWVLIWCLIPIVGPIFAVIRRYEYAFVPYLSIEEPDVKAVDVRDRSSQLTYGYKGKMFLADLIVAGIFLVVSMLLTFLARRVARFFIIIYMLWFLAFCLLAPLFMGMVHAAFYEEVTTMTEEKYMSFIQKPVRPAYPQQGGYQQQPQGYQQQTAYQSSYQQPQQAPVKVCPSCGNTVDAASQFCPKCGTRF